MKPLHVMAAALAATSLWVVAAESVGKLPPPWFVSGDHATSYEGGIDNVETSSGKGAKFLRYVQGEDTGYGSLAQVISAQRYLGQRVRFRAKIKTRNVNKWAGLWMQIRAEQPANGAFYNSFDQPLRGTSPWQMRSVTLDVPADATTISFGVNNAGSGQVWIDELSFEVVGKEVPVDVMSYTRLPEKPAL
ncbi:hypothetical protein FHW58_005037 [Duganella sp. 1224]|uniref:transcriptional regulator n=1 Tax=Duganella sp. 1224 TaxID=2587052 RepID=UPI0015C8CFEA|nr:transcriptional regulator [Duganella sp. 1224]NYE63803.1 hypothetical protein [Duganella sp. 1224]